MMQHLQIGELPTLNYPALVPSDTYCVWLFKHNEATLPIAAQVLEGIALQMLQQFAPKRAKILLFESVASAHFSQLKRLIAGSDHQWGEQIYREEDCRKQLVILEELVHRRFALLAQTGIKHIHDYNLEAAYPEPVIYILISGLSATLGDSAVLSQLNTLCREGPKVGIVPLLLRNMEDEHQSSISDALRVQQMRRFWGNVTPTLRGLDVREPIQSINLSEELWGLLTRFQLKLGRAIDSIGMTDALLTALKEKASAQLAQDFLKVRVGITGANPAYFTMGSQSNVFHAMIGGTTGSGKTTLLNSLILGSCEQFTPSQLQITLVDLKESGISFHSYDGLAHIADLYAPEAPKLDQAVACIAKFHAQMQERNTLFRQAGVKNLAEYNRISPTPIPYAVLIIDELQTFYESDDFKLSANIEKLLGPIAAKGRSPGMSLILCTQSYDKVKLSNSLFGNINLRIALRLSDVQACMGLMGIGRNNYSQIMALPFFNAIYNPMQGEEKYNRAVALDNAETDFDSRLDKLKRENPGIYHAKKALATATTEQPQKEDLSKVPAPSGEGIPHWLN